MKTEKNVILITGGGSGIGRGLAEAFHALGNQVIIAGRRKQALADTTAANPGMASMVLDIQDPADVRSFAARIGQAYPTLNVLINNSGIMLASPMLAEDSEAALRAEMEVTVFGMLRIVRAFAPVLARNGGGAMTNMLSVVSWYVFPFNATYCASKHAALALTEAATRLADRPDPVPDELPDPEPEPDPLPVPEPVPRPVSCWVASCVPESVAPVSLLPEQAAEARMAMTPAAVRLTT